MGGSLIIAVALVVNGREAWRRFTRQQQDLALQLAYAAATAELGSDDDLTDDVAGLSVRR
ncbi:hypothetical protein ACIREE_41630 [Streptomyces sp. NPDC102467]|uniref:hypothetical protein n=1 Tax=Streptomyces sp. NPDC102467 TaxID=3366179 RepID=UPI0038060946